MPRHTSPRKWRRRKQAYTGPEPDPRDPYDAAARRLVNSGICPPSILESSRRPPDEPTSR